mmetsp:Transcript_12318/g.29843  ORF Transcript_12318/g.29843 Transcript_12318/m.29843 type:complete len:297 (-) Transcript_12318:289-1179(-)
MSSGVETEANDDQDTVPEHLHCVTCFGGPWGRIEQCTNGHLLCAHAGVEPPSCVSKLRAQALVDREHPKCPTCRTELVDTPSRALTAEQTIAALPVICCHCKNSMQRGSLIDHQGVCPRAPVVCAAKDDGGCGWEGPRANQVEHEKTCVYVVVLAKIGPLRANFEGQILGLKASNATFVGQIQELQASKETSEGQILELKASHTKLEEEHKKLEQQHDKLQRDMLLRAATLGDVRTLSQVGGAEASGSPPLTPRSLHVHMTTKAAKRARLTLPPGFAYEDVAKPTQPSPARPRARE